MNPERFDAEVGPNASPEPPPAGRVERLAEALTMALYVSLSLLAVMVALPEVGDDDERLSRAFLVALTSTGLLLAHLIAFRLSTRLAHRGLLPVAQAELLGALVVGGLAVTLAAVVPIIVLGGRTGILVSELLMLGFVVLVGFEVARRADMSRGRTVAFLAGVVGMTLLVLLVKLLVTH